MCTFSHCISLLEYTLCDLFFFPPFFRLGYNVQHVLDASDVVVLEGTGHTAVGSVVDLNNAQVLLMREYRIPVVHA